METREKRHARSSEIKVVPWLIVAASASVGGSLHVSRFLETPRRSLASVRLNEVVQGKARPQVKIVILWSTPRESSCQQCFIWPHAAF